MWESSQTQLNQNRWYILKLELKTTCFGRDIISIIMKNFHMPSSNYIFVYCFVAVFLYKTKNRRRVPGMILF
jgi:hypothetical protein